MWCLLGCCGYFVVASLAASTIDSAVCLLLPELVQVETVLSHNAGDGDLGVDGDNDDNGDTVAAVVIIVGVVNC